MRSTTEPGPEAVPRPGSECAAPPCRRGALRCSLREGGCGTAVALLNAAQLHGSSPVRRLRHRTAPLSTALLADPYSPQRGTAPGPARRFRYPATNTRVVPGKAAGGCALAATLRGAEERRGVRVARRPEATRRPHIVRVPSAAALRSSVAPARGRVRVDALAARAPQGSRPTGPTAVHERRRTPARGFALPGRGTHGGVPR